MSLFDFLKWCFSDGDHAGATIIVTWLFFEGVKGVARACRGGE